MQKKKNGFLLFCFSFLPGAGELYLGFMKMGVSLLGMFFASISVIAIIGMPELSVIPALIYIYSFFHAHNIAGLSDEKFYSLEDTYLFGIDQLGELSKGKLRKWIAAAFIILGFVMIWNASLELMWDYLPHDNYIVKGIYVIADYAPRFLIGIAVIFTGCKLVIGKKEEETLTIEEKND